MRFFIIRMVGNDGFWTILAGPYPTKEQAYNAIDELRKMPMSASSSFNVILIPAV